MWMILLLMMREILSSMPRKRNEFQELCKIRKCSSVKSSIIVCLIFFNVSFSLCLLLTKKINGEVARIIVHHITEIIIKIVFNKKITIIDSPAQSKVLELVFSH